MNTSIKDCFVVVFIAFLAGLATGFWKSTEDIAAITMGDGSRTFAPKISDERRVALMDGWHKAVKKALL